MFTYPSVDRCKDMYSELMLSCRFWKQSKKLKNQRRRKQKTVKSRSKITSLRNAFRRNTATKSHSLDENNTILLLRTTQSRKLFVQHAQLVGSKLQLLVQPLQQRLWLLLNTKSYARPPNLSHSQMWIIGKTALFKIHLRKVMLVLSLLQTIRSFLHRSKATY